MLIVYFCTTTGFVISMHYCMDRMNVPGICPMHKKGGKCGMKNKDGCCRDHVKVVKLQTVHLTPEDLPAEFPAPAAGLTTTEFVLSPLEHFNSEGMVIVGSPPGNVQDTWLHNRVLRI